MRKKITDESRTSGNNINNNIIRIFDCYYFIHKNDIKCSSKSFMK